MKADLWIDQNPHVYALFERFAMQMHARGRRFGVKALAERVRWECAVTSVSDDGYKIANNHTAYVARRLIRDHPELASLIQTKRTRA